MWNIAYLIGRAFSIATWINDDITKPMNSLVFLKVTTMFQFATFSIGFERQPFSLSLNKTEIFMQWKVFAAHDEVF